MNTLLKQVMLDKIDASLIDLTAKYKYALLENPDEVQSLYDQREGLLERRKRIQDTV